MTRNIALTVRRSMLASKADAQDEKMQAMDEELQEINKKVEEVKGRVKEGAKYIERLRMERAEAEKQVKACKNEVEDGRVGGLYDWRVFCVTFTWVYHIVTTM